MYGLAATSNVYVPAGPGPDDVTSEACNTKWGGYLPTCWFRRIVYGSSFPNPPAPPVVRSTLPDGSPIPPVPASGQAAQATVDAIVQQQLEDWQQQNLDFFESIKPAPAGGISGLVWLALGLGVFGLVALSAGTPRRYGR